MTMKTVILVLVISIGVQFLSAQQARPIIGDTQALEDNMRRVDQGEGILNEALELLRNKGQRILKKKARSVTEKNVVPPSGDKRDFLSLAGYYWPNPKTNDGLPYVHKDGQWNPEASKIKDRSFLHELCRDIRILGVLYYYTKDESYAEKARELLLTWFINEDTKMNPNLNFAQAVRGINEGRATGIVDTREIVELLDGVELLKTSEAWTSECDRDLKSWFREYLNWLLTSKFGEAAKGFTNNIGTAYLAQVVGICVYTDDRETATKMLEMQAPKLLAVQFDKEGKQPIELKRKDAWLYSNSNLNQWLLIAKMSKQVGFDLWEYNTAGVSIKNAYLWLAQFAEGKKTWEYGRNPKTDMGESFLRLNKRVAPLIDEGDRQSMAIGTNRNAVNKGAHKSLDEGEALLLLTESNYF